MKCLCGYQYLSESDMMFMDPEFIPEDLQTKPFIEAESKIRFKMRYSDFSSDGTEAQIIYACPECGTLKINTGN